MKLPANLAADSKKFIGTIILNELLHAVRGRESLPPSKRHQFCIFVDEVQHFASSEDFVTLFTEARKYGIATTIAHQERYGQFADNKPMLGATDAAANKIAFQLSGDDAEKLAREFAKEPPLEERYEPEIVISRKPFQALLQGHSNPEIQAFIDRYLIPLGELEEDALFAMEGHRIARLDDIDEAALSRLEEHSAALIRYGTDAGPRYESQLAAMDRAERAIHDARLHTCNMIAIQRHRERLRQGIRGFNRFLVAIMEGKIVPGQEEYSDNLIACIQIFYNFSSKYDRFVPNPLELYIALTYGDPHTPRLIRKDFAKRYGLFPKAVEHVEKLERELIRLGQRWYLQCRWSAIHKIRRENIKRVATNKHWLDSDINSSLYSSCGRWIPAGNKFLKMFIALHEFEEIQQLLKPYYTAKFGQKVRNFDGFIEKLIKAPRAGYQEYPENFRWPGVHVRDWVVRAYETFFRQYGEGAVVTLALLETLVDSEHLVHCAGWHACRIGSSAEMREIRLDWSFSGNNSIYEYVNYPGYNTVFLPIIQNHDALEILTLFEKLGKITPKLVFKQRCSKYYEVVERPEPEDSRPLIEIHLDNIRRLLQEGRRKKTPRVERNPYEVDDLVDNVWADIFLLTSLKRCDVFDTIGEKRDDVQLLWKLQRDLFCQKAWPEGDLLYCRKIRERAAWWDKLEKLGKTYLIIRACDLFRFGQTIADMTFPQPAIPGVASIQVADVVSRLVGLLKEDAKRNEVDYWQRWWAARSREMREDLTKDIRIVQDIKWPALEKERRERHVNTRHGRVMMPDYLLPQVLRADERKELLQICHFDIMRDEEGGGDPWGISALDIVEDIVRFCYLLSLPENLITVPGGRYVKKKKNVRAVRDMIDEMMEELTELPRYTAYAKVIEERSGAQIVRKRKIGTMKPPPKPSWAGPIDELLSDPLQPNIRVEMGDGTSYTLPRLGDWSRLATELVEARTITEGFAKDRTRIGEESRQRRDLWRAPAVQRRALPDRRKSGGYKPPPTSE